MPIELRPRLAEGLRGQLLMRASSLERRFGTRRQLRKELTRVRSLAAGGQLPDITDPLVQVLFDLEERRRSNIPYGQTSSIGSAEELERLRQSRAEVYHYVKSCCDAPAALRKLIDDVLDFHIACPETREEWLGRKSALNAEKEWAVLWSLDYWVHELARSPSDMKGLVAFTDAVLRMNGFRLEEAAIRQQLAAIRKKYGRKP